MFATNDPTPCPAPRPGARPPPQSKHLGGPARLIDAKPRRPRASRNSFVWDPTVDIYDDTFAIQRHTRAAQNSSAGQPSERAQSLSRRDSLFAQPAQKIHVQPTQSTVDSDGEVKRRRISTTREDDTLNIQPAQQDKNVNGAGALHARAPLKKEPRRRTIYVPSEDTTIFTIHPGASLQERNAPSEKHRRSDVFFELASVAEDVTNTTQEITRSKPPRKSLAAAPRRGPLQPSSRQVQTLAPIPDIPGSGDGKENRPPRSPSSSKKLQTVPSRSSIFGSSKVHDVKTYTVDYKGAPTETNPPTADMITHSRTHRQSIANQRRNSGLLGNPAFNHSRRVSTLPQSMKGKPSLSPPERAPLTLPHGLRMSGTNREFDPYPVLTEHIENPELYEENWLTHQETAISQLINDLFERLNSTGDKQCQNKAVIRQKILDFYLEPAVSLMHKRLQASLRFGALSIPHETLLEVARFKDDLGQRQRFVDLWVKTYDLSALQIVAEVVIGREINANNDLVSPSSRSWKDSPGPKQKRHLEHFLKKFLILNEDIARSRSSISDLVAKFDGGMNSSLDTGSTSWLWRRTVLRSLMIIYLLDRAKESGVFGACIFQHTSPFKSSSAVLQALSALVIPSVGDITRTVGHLNYHVIHVQLPLVEKELKVHNLAIDLRDGVLLTRLIEQLLCSASAGISQDSALTVTLPCGEGLIWTQNSNSPGSSILSQHLRYPCLSRAQKLYNVQIALNALTSFDPGQNISHDIQASDVVDGHREKSLRLLWGLVGRWGLKQLLDFEMVQREIQRTQKRLAARNIVSSSPLNNGSIASKGNLPVTENLDDTTQLLQSWASNVASLHGVVVSNLSTSFSDSAAYEAIVEEYICAIGQGESHSSSNEGVGRIGDNTKQKSLNRKLQSLGCSQAFVSLFQRTHAIPSVQTTVSLLAFLASRLLPASRAHFAAISIQRSWRTSLARRQLRKRVILARLAMDCATVVTTRARIIEAALKIQRWWRSQIYA